MNDHVNPIFRHALSAMMAEPQAFDPWDDGIMHDVCGRLAKPVQALLITRSQLKRILGSFGEQTVDKAKMLDQIMPELDALYEACKEEWESM